MPNSSYPGENTEQVPIPAYQPFVPASGPGLTAYEPEGGYAGPITISQPDSKRPARRPRLVPLLLLAALAAAGVFGLNYVRLQAPMQTVMRQDSRNAGVNVSVHYQNYVNLSVLVYDIQSVASDSSPADVFRVLLQYAEEVQDQDFEWVELAYKGRTKFKFRGSHFSQMGEEYDWQNPMYTIRTFPEKLARPDGSRAYSVWSGGTLAVANAQMEDFNDFHKEWYIYEMAAGR